MNRYATYKDSGIPWLGEVPAHWEVKRLKFSISNISQKVESQTSDLRYFGLENIESFTGKLLLDVELESEGIANKFRKNDVLFGKLRPYLAKVHLSEQSGLVSTEALVFRTNQSVNSRYLFYFCVSSDFIDAVNGTTFGSKMPRASWEDIGNFKMLIPSLEEQIAIAHYLDTKLGEIDALIGKQQTLLEKLAEQRTAVITHAVTKGLNPAVPMKNSGVEWLGDVPAHWEMKAIKRVVKEHAGNGFPIELQGNNGDVPFLKVSDLNKGGKLLEDFANSVTRNIIYEMKWNIVPKFSLVTAKIGEALKKNHRKIISQDSIIDNNCIAFECLGINLDYHYYLSLIIDFDWFENGGTVPSLSVQKYKNQKICMPSLEEQIAIADYLDQETAKIDRLCDTVNQTIGRLKEYRTALITQAVTGKIKVTDE